MIIATEIGDKTFFIAAVLCMRNSRVAVFSGAILALIAMTIISTVMGFLLPRILPKAYTHIFGGILFIYFGYKLLRDSQALQEYKVSDELEEVEEELLHTSGKKDEDTVSARDGAGASNNVSDLQLKESSYNNHDEESAVIINTERPLHPEVDVQNPKGSQIYQVFIQSLVLTFLAEWVRLFPLSFIYF
jgi:putative Ca2+/H+ antiporter (TMEM165/GDT1 family)